MEVQKCTYSLTILSLKYSPKYFERKRRDITNPVSSDHSCIEITADIINPPKWRENVLNCRKCKRSLVNFISTYFLEKMKRKLRDRQKFITAGGFGGDLKDQAMSIEANGTPKHETMLECNAEETDTRIWLHDVYHIGLPFVANTDLSVMVRLSPFSSSELRILDMQALISAINNDPELATIPEAM